MLSADHRAILDAARRDLHEARHADLAHLSAPALILLVERLRGDLDDVLSLVTDLTD